MHPIIEKSSPRAALLIGNAFALKLLDKPFLDILGDENNK